MTHNQTKSHKVYFVFGALQESTVDWSVTQGEYCCYPQPTDFTP